MVLFEGVQCFVGFSMFLGVLLMEFRVFSGVSLVVFFWLFHFVSWLSLMVFDGFGGNLLDKFDHLAV